MVKVSLDPKQLETFLAALRAYAAETGQTMKDAALEQGALACQDAAIFTPPVVRAGGNGLSNAAKKAGEGAVEGDIRKTFIAANDRSASGSGMLLMRSAAEATRRNDFGGFERIISAGSIQALKTLPPIMRKIAADYDRDRAFKKAKNYFARTVVVKNEYGTESFVTNLKSIHDRVKGRYGGRMKKGQGPKLRALVESTSALKAYAKERMQMVGMVKAGWASALRSLPKPMINGVEKNFGTKLLNVAWINRHSVSTGTHTLVANEKIVDLYIKNANGNINNIATEANVLSIVYANRERQMKARLDRLQKRNTDKFNSK